MKRFGIDARLNAYRQGGISQYTAHLIRALADLDQENAYVIAHSRKDRRDWAIGPNQHRVNCWTPAHHRWERWALSIELAPLGLDLLHSPDFIPPMGWRFKLVITIHDLAFLMYPQILTAESHRYYTHQIQAAVRRADHILVVSEATRTDVIDRLGVSDDRISVTLEAADQRFKPSTADEVARVRSAHKLPQEYILFVGTLEPRKNIDGLLRAMSAIKAGPALVIAGRRGWLYEDIFKLVDELKLSERTIWLENVADKDLPALYTGASVFCLPSHYEGFGLPALEAMACGTPVVVSGRGSLPEVSGDAGILVNPDDPDSIAEGIRRALEDSELAADLRKRGIERAKSFTWNRMAEQTLAVYRQLVGN